MAKRVAKKEVETVVDEPVILAVKGFNKDLTCTPNGVKFQYEVDKTYKQEGTVKACRTGFHAIEGYPLEVFGYYAPAGSVFHEVELKGPFSKDNSDSKIAAAEITIKGEIKIPELVTRAIKWVMDRATHEEGGHATGYQGAASSTGNQGAASSTGNQGAASSTGEYGAASSTGEYGAASSTGNQGAASSTGYQGAASSTGEYGAASSTGNRGAASSTGNQGAASSTGIEGKVKGAEGNALFLVERVADWSEDRGKILFVWAGMVGQDGIKADTWYTLRGGQTVEVA